jgi:hypothetical protein
VPDGGNRRSAPVRLKAQLFHAADDGQFIRPGTGGVDQDAGLEGFGARPHLPAGTQALR